jgi:hypothetical protein
MRLLTREQCRFTIQHLLRVGGASDDIISVVIEASDVVQVTAHGCQLEVASTTFFPAAFDLAAIFICSLPSFALRVLVSRLVLAICVRAP